LPTGEATEFGTLESIKHSIKSADLATKLTATQGNVQHKYGILIGNHRIAALAVLLAMEAIPADYPVIVETVSNVTNKDMVTKLLSGNNIAGLRKMTIAQHVSLYSNYESELSVKEFGDIAGLSKGATDMVKYITVFKSRGIECPIELWSMTYYQRLQWLASTNERKVHDFMYEVDPQLSQGENYNGRYPKEFCQVAIDHWAAGNGNEARGLTRKDFTEASKEFDNGTPCQKILLSLSKAKSLYDTPAKLGRAFTKFAVAHCKALAVESAMAKSKAPAKSKAAAKSNAAAKSKAPAKSNAAG